MDERWRICRARPLLFRVTRSQLLSREREIVLSEAGTWESAPHAVWAKVGAASAADRAVGVADGSWKLAEVQPSL
jgi:hypothetical protein